MGVGAVRHAASSSLGPPRCGQAGAPAGIWQADASARQPVLAHCVASALPVTHSAAGPKWQPWACGVLCCAALCCAALCCAALRVLGSAWLGCNAGQMRNEGETASANLVTLCSACPTCARMWCAAPALLFRWAGPAVPLHFAGRAVLTDVDTDHPTVKQQYLAYLLQYRCGARGTVLCVLPGVWA